ncbi:MAG TPA: NADAR family protein [Pseudonocardiaceae bacterium]
MSVDDPVDAAPPAARAPADARDRAALVALERAGVPLDLLFFWGHTPRGGVVAGPWFLSQWWRSEFTVDGVRYGSAEQFMMAGKARLFRDDETLALLLAADDPREVKALGRRVRGFDEATWAAGRFDLVVRGNVAKFAADDTLRDYLLGTGDQVIVEASPEDRVWGIGLTAADERAATPSRWRGENLLGFALMEARARLRRA